MELVRDKIWRKWRDHIKSKSTQEIRYNPNIVTRTGSIQIGENTPCAYYTFYTVTQSMSKLFLVKYDEHFTWNLRKRRKTTANQWGITMTVATCVCKCLHRRLSHALNVHLRGAQKQFPFLMNKQIWTKYKQSNCTSEKTLTEENWQSQVTNSFHNFRKGKYVQEHIAALLQWYPHCFQGEWKLELFPS